MNYPPNTVAEEDSVYFILPHVSKKFIKFLLSFHCPHPEPKNKHINYQ